MGRRGRQKSYLGVQLQECLRRLRLLSTAGLKIIKYLFFMCPRYETTYVSQQRIADAIKYSREWVCKNIKEIYYFIAKIHRGVKKTCTYSIQPFLNDPQKIKYLLQCIYLILQSRVFTQESIYLYNKYNKGINPDRFSPKKGDVSRLIHDLKISFHNPAILHRLPLELVRKETIINRNEFKYFLQDLKMQETLNLKQQKIVDDEWGQKESNPTTLCKQAVYDQRIKPKVTVKTIPNPFINNIPSEADAATRLTEKFGPLRTKSSLLFLSLARG